MSGLKGAECRKFQANIFNKSKCTNCFKQREEHSPEALESNRVSIEAGRKEEGSTKVYLCGRSGGCGCMFKREGCTSKVQKEREREREREREATA
ncbi:Protein outspread [Portunus trituberculatus]|uniref:Protein outspread n=1 Tax=Portunus trituberculatus TaxID=210409 RepID=A0A5B7GM61_PORTR|nr:Protein outspread [Portunus trituberculatus]